MHAGPIKPMQGATVLSRTAWSIPTLHIRLCRCSRLPCFRNGQLALHGAQPCILVCALAGRNIFTTAVYCSSRLSTVLRLRCESACGGMSCMTIRFTTETSLTFQPPSFLQLDTIITPLFQCVHPLIAEGRPESASQSGSLPRGLATCVSSISAH